MSNAITDLMLMFLDVLYLVVPQACILYKMNTVYFLMISQIEENPERQDVGYGFIYEPGPIREEKLVGRRNDKAERDFGL